MKLLEVTLDDPAANVALDDALVEMADARMVLDEHSDGADHEVLRLWEPLRPMVVLGRSSRAADEVDLDACSALGIGIVRRASGGATIVTAPGCLMYAVVLSYRKRPELRAIDAAHRFVLDRLSATISRIVPGVARRGTSDLAICDAAGSGRKVSGNSMRCRRDAMLYHGTLLYDFPLELIGQLLRCPPRQPDYRQGRDHGAFVTNLPASRRQLCQAVSEAFGAENTTAQWPRDEVARQVREKYGSDHWTYLL
ncbi:MAG: lipoate--protein ligase family protein [Pirellulales bacterium]